MGDLVDLCVIQYGLTDFNSCQLQMNQWVIKKYNSREVNLKHLEIIGMAELLLLRYDKLKQMFVSQKKNSLPLPGSDNGSFFSLFQQY